MPAVLVIQIAGNRRSLALDGRTTIGRSEACRLRLNANAVSRQHAVVDRAPDDPRWFIEDTGSLNGTWVNLQRVTARRALASRDRIRIGDARLAFVVLADTPVGVDAKREIIDGKSAGVLFRCPVCRKKLIAPPGSVKSLRRCGKCRARFVVPVAKSDKVAALPPPIAPVETPAPPSIPDTPAPPPEPITPPVVTSETLDEPPSIPPPEPVSEAPGRTKKARRARAPARSEPNDRPSQTDTNEPAPPDRVAPTPTGVDVTTTDAAARTPDAAPFIDAFPPTSPSAAAHGESPPSLPAIAPIDDAPVPPQATTARNDDFTIESLQSSQSRSEPQRDTPPPDLMTTPSHLAAGDTSKPAPNSTVGSPPPLDVSVTLEGKPSPPPPAQAEPSSQTFHVIAPAEHVPTRSTPAALTEPARVSADPIATTPASSHPTPPAGAAVPPIDTSHETHAIQRGPSPTPSPVSAAVNDPTAHASPPSASGVTPNVVEPVPPRPQRPKPVAFSAPSHAVVDRAVVVMSRPPVAAPLPRDQRVAPTRAAPTATLRDTLNRGESTRSTLTPHAAPAALPSLRALHLGNRAMLPPVSLPVRGEPSVNTVDAINFIATAPAQRTHIPAGASARRLAPSFVGAEPVAGCDESNDATAPAVARSSPIGAAPAPSGFLAAPDSLVSTPMLQRADASVGETVADTTPPSDSPAVVRESPRFELPEPRSFIPPASLPSADGGDGEPTYDIGSTASASGLFGLRRFARTETANPQAGEPAPTAKPAAVPTAPAAPEATPEPAPTGKRQRGPVPRSAVADYFARSSACRAARSLASPARIKRIVNLGSRYESLTDAEIRGELTGMRFVFRLNRESPEHIDTALALSREVMRRLTGVRPLPEHLAAALALDAGCFVELGHGTSIAVAIAAALTATRGRGCHVLSANEEVAQTDSGAFRPFYRHFGLRVAHLISTTPVSQRRTAYACDVTYATMLDVLADCVHDQLDAARPRPPADKLRKAPLPPPPLIRGYAAALLCEARDALEPDAPVWPAPLDHALATPRADNPPSKASVPKFLLRYRKLAGVAAPASGLLKSLWAAYNLPLVTSKP